jgi:hypothetical protein
MQRSLPRSVSVRIPAGNAEVFRAGLQRPLEVTTRGGILAPETRLEKLHVGLVRISPLPVDELHALVGSLLADNEVA